jgi:hypothetical protein
MKLEQIDTSTTAGKAEVMRLAAEGRRVAARWHGREANAWWSPDRPEWDWTKSDYAIIAEPVGPDEVWVQQRDGALWAYPEDREGCVRYVRADE